MKRKSTVELSIPSKKGGPVVKHKFEYKKIDFRYWDYVIEDESVFVAGKNSILFGAKKKGVPSRDYIVKFITETEVSKTKEIFEREVRFAEFAKLMNRSDIMIRVYNYGILAGVPTKLASIISSGSLEKTAMTKELVGLVGVGGNDFYFIVMEKMEGNIFDFVEQFKDSIELPAMTDLFSTLVQGLFKLLKVGIMLNNIEPINLLYKTQKGEEEEGESARYVFKFANYNSTCFHIDIDKDLEIVDEPAGELETIPPLTSDLPTNADVKQILCSIKSKASPFYIDPQYERKKAAFEIVASRNIWALGQTLLQMLTLNTNNYYVIVGGFGSSRYKSMVVNILLNPEVTVIEDLSNIRKSIDERFTSDKEYSYFLETMIMVLFMLLESGPEDRYRNFKYLYRFFKCPRTPEEIDIVSSYLNRAKPT